MQAKYREIVRAVPNSDCEFEYVEIGRGQNRPVPESGKHKLLFVLDGQIRILQAETRQLVENGRFTLLPVGASGRIVAVGPVRMLLLSFRTVEHVWPKAKIKRLLAACPSPQPERTALPIPAALSVFLNLLVLYTTEADIDKSLYTGKDTELLSLLYTFCEPAGLAALFFPVLRNDTDFRSFVLANYQKVDKASDLAELAGCSLVTLNRKFKEYFNDSAYQWMLKNRTEKIRQRLQHSSMSLTEIAREFGFYSSSELNRFCRSRFGMSAGKVRRSRNAETQSTA